MHGAAGAARAQFQIGSGRLAGALRRDVLRALERRGGEVARRELAHSLQHAQVRARAEHAVLRRLRAERALAQRRREPRRRRRIRDAHLAAAAQCDRLEPLRAEHGAGTAAPRLAAVVLDGCVAHAALARDADRAHAQRTVTVRVAQRFGRLARGEPRERRRVLEAHRIAVDRERRPRVRRAGDDDRREPAAPQHRGEMARRQPFVEQAGQRRDRRERVLVRGGHRRRRERTGREHDRIVGTERVERAAHAFLDQPHRERDAAERVGEHVVAQRRSPRRARAEVDLEQVARAGVRVIRRSRETGCTGGRRRRTSRRRAARAVRRAAGGSVRRARRRRA